MKKMDMAAMTMTGQPRRIAQAATTTRN